jgi:hypothetical protein
VSVRLEGAVHRGRLLRRRRQGAIHALGHLLGLKHLHGVLRLHHLLRLMGPRLRWRGLRLRLLCRRRHRTRHL